MNDRLLHKVSPAQGQSVSESKFDFSGLERFWEIYETLRADREPEREQWDRLFATPGYAALEEREHKRKVLSEALRLAYMPSKREQLDAVIKKGGWLAYVLPHLQKVPLLRAELTAFQSRIGSTKLMIRAAKRTQELLPPGLTRRYPPPPVSFIFFAPDGRGYPKIIVADLLNMMLYPEIERFFAHELFHFYRRYLVTSQLDYAEADVPLMEILTNVQEEGIADQLDKSDLPFLSEQKLKQMFPDPERRSFYEDYRRYYAESNEWVRRVEKVLEEIDREPATVAEKGRLLHQQLPIDGRPLGAFMARTILRELDKNQLVNVVGDPLSFWLLYNKAARHSKGHSYLLSRQAMSVIERLSQTYARG